MPQTITRDQATGPMRQTWDRLTKAHATLDEYGRTKVGDRDALVSEQVAAVNAYWKACRAAGYIGRNGRTRVPHLEKAPSQKAEVK